MRVLHVIDSLDPATGGPPVVMTRLAAAQAGLGHDVSLAAFGPLPADRSGALLAGVPHAGQLRLRWISQRHGRLAAKLGFGVGRDIDDAVAASDVVHAHGVWDILIRAACTAAHRKAVPYVITPHGMLDPWSLSQRAAKKRIALALGYRRILAEAAFLHALNRDEADLIAPLGLPSRVEVIPNGIFLEEIEPLPSGASFRTEHAIPTGVPYVLFLGRLHYKKGLDYLAEAFAIFARSTLLVRLVVAGPDGGAGEDFRRLITERGIADRIDLVGPLYGPKKYAAIAGAACFCLPSRQEGFSIAVLEALACGVPAVLSTACHFPQVEEKTAGYVVDNDPQQIASAIARVLEAGQPMRDNARSLVRAGFLWRDIAATTLARYADVTGRTDPLLHVPGGMA